MGKIKVSEGKTAKRNVNGTWTERDGSCTDPVDAKDLLLLRLSLQLAPGGSTSEPKALAKIS